MKLVLDKTTSNFHNTRATPSYVTVQGSGILLEYSMAVINSDLLSPALFNKKRKKPLDCSYFPFQKSIHSFSSPILFPFQLLEEMQEPGRSENKTASYKPDFSRCTGSFNTAATRSSGMCLGSPEMTLLQHVPSSLLPCRAKTVTGAHIIVLHSG